MPGEWQSARSLGEWTLVGCTVSPAFTFEGFQLAPEGWVPGSGAATGTGRTDCGISECRFGPMAPGQATGARSGGAGRAARRPEPARPQGGRRGPECAYRPRRFAAISTAEPITVTTPAAATHPSGGALSASDPASIPTRSAAPTVTATSVTAINSARPNAGEITCTSVPVLRHRDLAVRLHDGAVAVRLPALAPAQVARGTRGAVACPNPLAAGAGIAVLRAGGSAVDAAIATNAALAVVQGHSCGLGGDAFWLIRDPDGRDGPSR